MSTTAAAPLTAVGDGATGTFLVVTRLSLLAALVNVHDRPVVLAVVVVVTVAVWFRPRVLGSPWPWLALAAVLGTAQASEWWLVDDHRVATTYWLGALGLSRFAADPTWTMRRSARLLLGVLFLLASGWKVASSQYTSGDVFRYTLLRDDRFEPAALVLGGAEVAELDSDRVRIAAFTANAEIDDVLFVREGPRVPAVATVFTWWGIAIEAAIAAAFLVPLRGRWRRLRPATLLAFCLTTYALVPVVGFGVLLVTVGLAAETETRLRPAYVGVAIAVFAWGAVLSTVLR